MPRSRYALAGEPGMRPPKLIQDRTRRGSAPGRRLLSRHRPPLHYLLMIVSNQLLDVARLHGVMGIQLRAVPYGYR